MINVTKTFLPPRAEYDAFLDEIWKSYWVTNHGPLVRRLESEIKQSLGVDCFQYVNNGTIAIQIAIKALKLKGEIITTPFSYVATTSSIVWEGCTPVFADIESDSLTIDPVQIEKRITDKTSAILATHVYGNPCDVEAIEKIATQHDLKVIYDAAHCFGVNYKGRSILNYGDVSTLSFHATKLFHTIEGGGVVASTKELNHLVSYMANFGHNGPEDFYGVGINAKTSEFHAAMGLCLIDRVPGFIARRSELSLRYDELLIGDQSRLRRPKLRPQTEYNFSYYPIIFESESSLLRCREALLKNEINPRRYFYPSLSTLNYVRSFETPVCDDISKRILCLPLYVELAVADVERISKIILNNS